MLHIKRLFTLAFCVLFFAAILGGVAYVIVAATAGTFTPGAIGMGAVRLLAAVGGLFGLLLGIIVCVQEGKAL